MKRQPTTTRWFSVDADGYPHRPGVYLSTWVGTPESGYVMQLGFRFWSGMGWTWNYETVEAAYEAQVDYSSLRVANWQGVMPPRRARDEPDPWMEAGVLLRPEAADSLEVAWIIEGDFLHLRAVRRHRDQAPVSYKAKLEITSSGKHYGKTKGLAISRGRLSLPGQTEFTVSLGRRASERLPVEIRMVEDGRQLTFVGESVLVSHLPQSILIDR